MTSKVEFCLVCYVTTILLVTVGRSAARFNSTNSTYMCEPELDCEYWGIGAKVPDPNNCSNYYLCIDSEGDSKPSSVPIQCPPDEAFDFGEGDCAATTEPCVNHCINFCQAYCVNEFDLLADPNNCTNYFVCINGDPLPAFCSPPYPYFDGATCTNDSYSCCDVCTPYCISENVETYDPLDCHSYYVCVQQGIPSDEYYGTCETGDHFDPQVGRCVSGNTCDNLCSSSATTRDLQQQKHQQSQLRHQQLLK